MKTERVVTEKAPAALGPYSAAVKAGGFVYTSGQLPVNPVTNELVAGSVAEMTRQSLTNIQNILEAAGTGMDRVVKTVVFLADMNDFAEMNAAYAGFFGEVPPARSCVQVAKLPKGARLEIEAVALL